MAIGIAIPIMCYLCGAFMLAQVAMKIVANRLPGKRRRWVADLVVGVLLVSCGLYLTFFG